MMGEPFDSSAMSNQMTGGVNLPATADYGDMMPGGQAPPDQGQQPSPLLALLMQLLAPSIQAAAMGSNLMGMPSSMQAGSMTPSLADSMQSGPSQPPPQLY